MNQKHYTLWYFSVAIIFIILENLNLGLSAFIAKALIIPSLMVFYHKQLEGNYSYFHRLIMSGLFFSWIGDLCLKLGDFPGFPLSSDILFLAGLGSFLFTHIIYFLAFTIAKGKNTIFSKRLYQLILVLLYGSIMLYYLYRSLGDMKVPVIAYTSIILLMLLAALNRYGKVNGLSYILVVIGALLFVFSDSLIAITKFQMKISFAGVIIMLTYVLAQYLIVLGCIRQSVISDNSK
ncbi:MAG: lysoplasmalogenase [Bacteroidales bacterium]|nr:lysoplasmalogenase [Bacteroidales bacterium]